MNLPAREKGFVLIVSIIILFSLALIAAGFVSMLAARSINAAAALDSAKSFWLAEAGIQQAVYKLKNDANYRSSPTDLNGNLGSGTYVVTAAQQSGQNVFSISSTGTSGNITRTITQKVTVIVGGWVKQFTDYGTFDAANAVISLKHSSIINGDVYAAKNVQTDQSSSVTGTVYASSGSGNYMRQPLPNPPLVMPTFSTTYYKNMIATAKTYTKRDYVYNTLNLAGSTIYVNGTITAKNITGPGTIVCASDFVANGGTIGSDITIISGNNITANSNSNFESGTVLYGNSLVQTSSIVNMANTAILTLGSVRLTNTVFNGAIYSAGNVLLDKGTIVIGAVVTSGMFTLDHSSQVIQNANFLPAKVPTGLEHGGESMLLVLSDWNGE
ncbi:MAG: hypothetical protein WCY05_00200 [Candidatus Omnitrophota bacterium]